MYHFLQENDVLIVEQGTPFFGSAAIPLPNNTAYVGQPLWIYRIYTARSTWYTARQFITAQHFNYW